MTTGLGINAFESDERDANLGDIVAAYAPAGAENPLLQSNIKANVQNVICLTFSIRLSC
jgi:hypothetical protein